MNPLTLDNSKSKKLQLPDGYSARPVDMNDLEAAHEMFNACSIVQIGQADTPLHAIRSEWELADFNLAESTRAVFNADGRLVGYIEVWDINEIPNRIWVWGRVHPDYEGLGLGHYLMGWAEDRARQAIPRVPAEARVSMQSGTVSSYEPAKRLFESLDMKLARHFWEMQIDFEAEPSAAQLPAGIVIRSMIPQQEERAVIQAVRDSFQDHWGYVEQPFEQEFERWQHFMKNDPDYDPTLWLVAWDGEEIAGISLCAPKSDEDPDMGWIKTLGVRRPWRRRGLGLALLQESFCELYRRGRRKAGLGVDAASLTGATRLYEKAGMRVARQYDTYEKELRPGQELSVQSI